MKNHIALFCMVFSALLFALLSNARADYIWPIDRPEKITGTFGEYRSAHFHHGIDVSCSGRKGFKISSAEDGYISSVMYQKWGIGYAVFIRHPDGRTTFYGHMDGFATAILLNDQVKKQYNNILDRRDFRIDFKNSEIRVAKGALVGYSGDSGIGLEHFHFEVRDRDGELLNPLKYGIPVKDSTAPIFEELYLVPLDGYSQVDGNASEAFFPVVVPDKKNKVYSLGYEHTPTISGRIGVKIKVYDNVGAANRVAVYRLETYINGKKVNEISFDKIIRRFSHRIGLYYDYDNSSMADFTYFLYSRSNQEGSLEVKKVGTVKLQIIAWDAGNNRSVFETELKTAAPPDKPAWVLKPNLIPGRSLELTSRDEIFRAKFPDNAPLYREKILLEEDKAPEIKITGLTVRSKVYYLSPTNLCLDHPAQVSIRYRDPDARRVGIFVMDREERHFRFLGNRYKKEDGEFIVNTARMGKFFLIRDDFAPGIRFSQKQKIVKGKIIKLFVFDVGTGIDYNTIYLKVDNRDVVWDYDIDRGNIEILPHNGIWAKGKHIITVQVQDRAGNKSEMKNFTYSI